MNVVNNARWVALSQGAKILVQVVGMVVLARLVSPFEYGLMAMATIVTNFAMIFRDMGSSAAIIQRERLDENVKNATFWFNFLMGTCVALIIVAGAPIIAIAFKSPRLTHVLILLAPAFPISSSAAVHQALLERVSNFKSVAIVEVVSLLLGLLLAILLALWGAGVYSLVAQTLVTMTLSSTLLWGLSKWRPKGIRSFHWKDLKSILGFSSNLVVFGLINYFSRNADGMIIGRNFPASVLGVYSLAYRIMLFPLQSLTFVATRALYPVLARQQNNINEMRRAYLGVLMVVIGLVAPMMAGIVMVREDFIHLYLGAGWGLAANLLIWLAPTGFIQSILSTSGTVFMATGATRTLMFLGALGAILQVGAFLIGVRGGIEIMVKWYFLANVINFFPVMVLCLKQLQGSILEVFRLMVIPLLSVAIMMLVLIWIRNSLTENFEPGIRLIVLVISGLGLYVSSYAVLDRNGLKNLGEKLKKRQ